MDQPLDLDTEVVDDPDAGTTCECGRVRAASSDLERWCAAVPGRAFYGMSPSTWQSVRLGRCLPPNTAHLDPGYPAWALALCWTLGARCRLPKVASLGPATSADLLELDAVPDPIDSDSDAPGVPYATPIPITDLAELWERGIAASARRTSRAERCLDAHGYGCARPECGRAPVREGDIRGLAPYVPSRNR